MIVKQSAPSVRTRWGYLLPVALLLGILGILLAQKDLPEFKPEVRDPSALSCSAEQITHDTLPDGQVVTYFLGQDGTRLPNGHTQSDAQARTGRFSSQLDSTHRFGMTYVFQDLKPGDRFYVSIWRYVRSTMPSALVVHLSGNHDHYAQIERPDTTADGWERLSLAFALPLDYREGELRFYAFGYGGGVAYFDDLDIRRERLLDSLAAYAEFPQLNLRIPDKGMEVLDAKRQEAISRGLLTQGEDDWVKARLDTGGQEIPVRVRLKGDLPDHFLTPKWSFRVRAKAPHAWSRMVTFSLHTPLARGHLDEWFYHSWLRREDVLSPRYDFVKLSINGEPRGLYAYEEHFDKQLVESAARREGPILKFDEAGVWALRQRATDYDLDWGEMERLNESYQQAPAQPFGEEKAAANPALRPQLDLALELMHQFQTGSAPASELFDLDRLARFFVITDISRAYHGLIWHNLRFYYNPVLGKLEPIGFDGFTETGAFEWLSRPFMGAQISDPPQGQPAERSLMQLFLDPAFAARYYHYLLRYTEPGYLQTLFMELAAPLERRQALIQEEFPGYAFDSQAITRRAGSLRRLLLPYGAHDIEALTEGTEAGQRHLALRNRHLTPLVITAWGRTADGPSASLDTAFFLPSQPNPPVAYRSLRVPAEAQYLFYHLPGMDSLLPVRILPYGPAAPRVPSQALFAGIQVETGPWYEVRDRQIHFRAGAHRVDRDIVIPAGYEVFFPPGTELTFVGEAAFISRSPVYMFGEEARPVRLLAPEGQASGFTVLQAGRESVMRYVEVNGFNTLRREGWNLTGAVTFYESDVRIDHCTFTRNQCEDGLNLVRCQFELTASTLSHTFSDAFDADFCTGKVSHCHFFRTGNDAMDVSGSQVEISDCTVEYAGDKGLSVGEESTAKAWRVQVRHAVIGMAAKDLSRLQAAQIRLEDCGTGFAAYQKKPEFGPAQIEVNEWWGSRIKRLHLVERGSTLQLNGQAVETI